MWNISLEIFQLLIVKHFNILVINLFEMRAETHNHIIITTIIRATYNMIFVEKHMLG